MAGNECAAPPTPVRQRTDAASRNKDIAQQSRFARKCLPLYPLLNRTYAHHTG
jgi:hypothetical protein